MTMTHSLPIARRLLWLAWLLPLTAIAQPTVIKSPQDAKEYRTLQLDNGLRVLLVSDADADKAAASLEVDAGSGHDPIEWPGLAHFLEHMLFLGTEKYPQSGEYKEFIGGHGGDDNAYTALSSTNYFFDISAPRLRPALDRFARFFIDPTFDATYVERERAVVDSEFQARRRDEGRRLYAARRQLIHPDHPESRFKSGTAETLQDRDGVSARDILIEFYRRHYRAERMTLVVVGREPLDTLQEWVTESFAEVPRGGMPAAPFTAPRINPQHLGKHLTLRPLETLHSVTFLFPVDSTEVHYRTKPISYLANLIGHEGEGSLLAALIARGWADGLSAGVTFMDEVQGTFGVSVSLTEAGAHHWQEIGALLFRYIALIRADGIEEWRYDEERRLAEIAFRFAGSWDSIDLASGLTAAMHRYPAADVLRGSYLMADYRPELISAALEQLRVDRVVVERVLPGESFTEITPYYDVEFALQPIPPAVKARWRAAARGEAAAADGSAAGEAAALALPHPNPFIPERLQPHAFAAPESQPRRLPATPRGMTAWHHSDGEFGVPRAAFYFNMQSPHANSSPRDAVLTELLVGAINRQLNQFSYPAILAGLSYQLYRHGRGISVRIDGFEDKQSTLLVDLLAALRAPTITADTLDLMKAELRRKWRNIGLQSPSRQSVHELYRLLLSPYWDESERLAVLDSIEVADVIAHGTRLFTAPRINVLSHGDVTPERAAERVRLLEAAFDTPSAPRKVAAPETRRVGARRDYLHTMEVAHEDVAVAYYFQGPRRGVGERAKMELLAQLIGPPFFHDLRTTHSVGYLVQASPVNIREASGLLLLIQSPDHTPQQITALVNDFLEQFGEMLATMDEAQFDRVKEGLIARTLAREQRIDERSDRYWQEIDRKRYDFDTRERLAARIEAISLPAMQRYYRSRMQNRPHQLILQVAAADADGRLGGAPYTEVSTAEFRARARKTFRAP